MQTVTPYRTAIPAAPDPGTARANGGDFGGNQGRSGLGADLAYADGAAVHHTPPRAAIAARHITPAGPAALQAA